jgi:hypothetical protein
MNCWHVATMITLYATRYKSAFTLIRMMLAMLAWISIESLRVPLAEFVAPTSLEECLLAPPLQNTKTIRYYPKHLFIGPAG